MAGNREIEALRHTTGHLDNTEPLEDKRIGVWSPEGFINYLLNIKEEW